MSNKSKNIGTVTKANIYLQGIHPLSVVAMRLANHTFNSVHFAWLVCLDNSRCVLNSATVYVYIYRLCGVVWCGTTKLALSDNRS